MKMMILLLRTCVAALVLTLLVTGQHINEDKLQLLNLHNDTSTINTTNTSTINTTNTTSIKLHLLVQEGLQHNNNGGESDEESLNLESANTQTLTPNSTQSKTHKVKKPSSVGKKGVTLPKPSVPKKGADPESSTPSVSPRKGVVYPDPKPIPPDGKVESPSSGGKMSELLLHSEASEESMIHGGSNSNKDLSKDSNKPMPQLINTDVKIKSKPISPTQKPDADDDNNHNNNLTRPTVSDVIQKTPPVHDLAYNTLIQSDKNVSSNLHSKPAAAMDVRIINDHTYISRSEQVNYILVISGIVFIVVLVMLIVVGYRKFQDVWMRRHYNHVDFLVEGMYDE